MLEPAPSPARLPPPADGGERTPPSIQPDPGGQVRKGRPDAIHLRRQAGACHRPGGEGLRAKHHRRPAGRRRGRVLPAGGRVGRRVVAGHGRLGRGPAILCDFDGTLTVGEVSISLLDEFSGGEWRKADQDLLSGRITLRQTMEREFGLLRASRAQMERHVRKMPLRAGFRRLRREARRRGTPLLIVSEGLDFYIREFLRSKGIRASYRTNRAVFTDRGIIVKHPHADAACDRCGTCKLALLRDFRRRGFSTVYIGDGISDRCPAGSADLLFARDGLLEHCRKEGLDCIPYEDFDDVLGVLERRFWGGARCRPGAAGLPRHGPDSARHREEQRERRGLGRQHHRDQGRKGDFVEDAGDRGAGEERQPVARVEYSVPGPSLAQRGDVRDGRLHDGLVGAHHDPEEHDGGSHEPHAPGERQ
ncbi:MAG: HAD-IB family phosphatase [Euryarchaeota archaeon]|nr:HAD-IB family phosphatase [Euryarchaeota archaeon]